MPRVLPSLIVSLALALGSSAQETASSDSGSQLWGADYFPNVPLVTHEGRTVRFFDDLVQGKVVVINFIYTSCADACPLETARLAEVQEILGERVGQDVFMYSISIDPERDTVPVLKEYAERFRVRPGWWFLTGTEDDITEVRKKLGLYVDLVQTDGSKNHNLSVVIGNQATGRWMRTSPMENPYVIAAKIGDWLHNWKAPRPEGQDYEDAPELRTISRGESLFRTRCNACHVIGPGDGKARPGPNLLGVMERRERDWLERWLHAPDEMIAAGDPIATGLYEAFGRVQMPNLRLNELEIGDLLEYLDTEGRRVAHAERLIDELPERGPDCEPAACCRKDEAPVLASAAAEPAAEEPGTASAAADRFAVPEEWPEHEDEFFARTGGPSLAEPGSYPAQEAEAPPPSPVTRVVLDRGPADEPAPEAVELPAEAPVAASAAVGGPRPPLSPLARLSVVAGLLLGSLTLVFLRRAR